LFYDTLLIVSSPPIQDEHRGLLASSYRSFLKIAEEYSIKSVAFCCISTGEFRFPNGEAAKIAVGTTEILTFARMLLTDKALHCTLKHG